jgi:hypothetical protein
LKTPKPKDPTAAKRAAALKERLQQGGGLRMSINLDGTRVKKLDKLVKNGKGINYSEVIRALIDEAK